MDDHRSVVVAAAGEAPGDSKRSILDRRIESCLPLGSSGAVVVVVVVELATVVGLVVAKGVSADVANNGADWFGDDDVVG